MLETGDHFRIAFRGTCFNQRVMFTHHYTCTFAAPGTSDLDAQDILSNELVAGGGTDILETKYLDLLPSEYRFDTLVVQKIAPVRIRQTITVRDQPGAHATDCHTANVHAAMELVTDFAGRNQVSIKKIGPVPDGGTVFTLGVLGATYLSKIVTLKNALLSTITVAVPSIVWRPSIVHRTTPLTSDFLTAGVTQSTVRVNTRRTVGRGE